jgi:ParB family transcriptional regulator, chromosome partitioning protein
VSKKSSHLGENVFNEVGSTFNSIETLKEIMLTLIEPPEWQPRKKFDQQKLEELKNSIKLHGLLQPMIVEPIEGGRYRIIAGERRFRALSDLKAEFVQVRILEKLTEEKRIQIQITENLMREDITPLERSKAVYKLFQQTLTQDLDGILKTLLLYHRDMKRLNEHTVLTVRTVLDSIGKNETTISRWLNLLKLPVEIQEKLDDPNGAFTPKHAGEIMKLTDIKDQIELAKLIETEKLSAEQTKAIVDRKIKPEHENFASYAKKLIDTISRDDALNVLQKDKGHYLTVIDKLLEDLQAIRIELTK